MDITGDEPDVTRDGETWRARIAADLDAYRLDQEQAYGGIDEMLLEKYEAGLCTAEEKARVEDAMQAHPALRECIEIARRLSVEDESLIPSKSAAAVHQPARDGRTQNPHIGYWRLSIAAAAAIAATLLTVMIYRGWDQPQPPKDGFPQFPKDAVASLEARVRETMNAVSLGRPLCAQNSTIAPLVDSVRTALRDKPQGSSHLFNRFLMRTRLPDDQLQIIVPAYFYPAGDRLKDWSRLIDASAKVPIVAIVNPASGPGTRADSNYADVIRRARAAGVRILGFVSTGFGKRKEDDVKDEMRRWAEWYPKITGFYFDEAGNNELAVQQLREYAHLAKKTIAGAQVAVGTGIAFPEALVDMADVDILCIEGDERLVRSEVPSWAANYPARRFAALRSNAVAITDLRQSIKWASSNRVGCLYVTDKRSRLPSFWSEQVEEVKRFNQDLANCSIATA